MAEVRLTAAMREALADLGNGPFVRRVHGWANDPRRGHSRHTVAALIRRGLAEAAFAVPVPKSRRATLDDPGVRAVLTAAGRVVAEAAIETKGRR
jgi:hypothetical protein